MGGPFAWPSQVRARNSGKAASFANVGADTLIARKVELRQLVACLKGLLKGCRRLSTRNKGIEPLLTDALGRALGMT